MGFRSWRGVRQGLLLGLLVAPVLVAQVQPRRPRGIYTKVNITDHITAEQQANPSITPEQLDAYFNSLYQDLLSNPAISGLEIFVHWDQANPNPPSSANPYFWNYLDDAFNQAAAWNAQNPAQIPKTIQLIALPGFQSPQWILAEIPSCDGLFQTPAQTPPSTCGTATFTGYLETVDGTVLPLPWDPVYKSAWQAFLVVLAARYGSNPTLVSVAVAGPTAASPEMQTASNTAASNPQTQFGVNIAPNDMWSKLLAFHWVIPPLPRRLATAWHSSAPGSGQPIRWYRSARRIPEPRRPPTR
jgi:hypothetical protein